jgi:hypothetical protein
MRLSIVLLVLAIPFAFLSCKKDDSSGDARNKYIGIWSGTQHIVFPDFPLNETYNVHYRITNGPEARQIMLFDLEDPSVVYTAKVSNSIHVYDTYYFTTSISGILITIAQSGTGQISGNTITESGGLVYTSNGYTRLGTWSQSLTRSK